MTTDRTPVPLTEALDLRVTDTDSGDTQDYRTSGVDVYRVERFTGKSSAELTGSYTAIAYLAYSAARRAGHAYRQRKAATSEADLFEQWLDTHEVSILTDGGDPDPKDDDRPAPGSPLE